MPEEKESLCLLSVGLRRTSCLLVQKAVASHYLFSSKATYKCIQARVHKHETTIVETPFMCRFEAAEVVPIQGIVRRDVFLVCRLCASVLSAATIVQSKVVAQQGLEEGEQEENRGREEVEDLSLGWMEACCTALELHPAEADVQVGRRPLFVFYIFFGPRRGTGGMILICVYPLPLPPQEAASWAIHNLSLHGAAVNHSEGDQRYTLSATRG